MEIPKSTKIKHSMFSPRLQFFTSEPIVRRRNCTYKSTGTSTDVIITSKLPQREANSATSSANRHALAAVETVSIASIPGANFKVKVRTLESTPFPSSMSSVLLGSECGPEGPYGATCGG
eukprot:TRINITY_DN99231_c0_g1_i1.p2 TRINITY_DN99231_c0_g1~~TRINITY_DN99231_c0_g1_i1.p2  ORF type:complete len:120 (-),score=13.33 TRINITY_DN99231_c0_g1_i1:519-878(-)